MKRVSESPVSKVNPRSMVRTSSFKSWFLMVLVTVGTFVIATIVGFLLAAFLGIWPEPAAGFLAAFLVVFMASFAAPSHKPLSAILTFAIGAAAAWYLLEPSFYPESFPDKAYQATHMPWLMTCSGGILGLLVAILTTRKGMK